MLPHTPPTYVGTKRRTGPMDFHINKMRAFNLSAKYMKKVEAELRGLPGTFNDLPVTPLMNIGEMVDSSAFDQVNKATANAEIGDFYVVPGCTKKNDGGPGDKYKAMTTTPTM